MAKYIVEGKWDCTYCGTTGIGGHTKVCPGCGRPVGENVKYYVDDVSPEKAIKPSGVDDLNPEWRCSYCGAYNKYSATKCQRCSASKEADSKDYFDIHGKQAEEWMKTDKPIEERTEQTYETKPNAPTDSQHNYSPRSNSDSVLEKICSRTWKTSVLISIIILLVVALIAGGIYFFAPHEQNVLITGKEWSRSIAIEKYMTVEENDWSVPSGGRVKYVMSEIHHYTEVLDHYETKVETKSRRVIAGYDTETYTRDLGNGNFEVETRQVPRYETEFYTETYQEPVYVSVPVYATKYYYEIERWKYFRSVNTSGTSGEPYWGSVELSDLEREGSHSEKYTLYYAWKDDVRSTNVNYDVWEKYSKDDTAKVKINRIGVISEFLAQQTK